MVAIRRSLKRFWQKHTRYKDCLFKSKKKRPELFTKIELTNYCNQKCIGCNSWSAHREQGRADLSLKKFETIAKKLFGYVHYLQIGSVYEPLLNPQSLDIIRSLRNWGLPNCSITTNGTVLDREMADTIVQSGAVHAVSISLDGISRNTYKKMRGRDDLDKVLAGIENIVQAKKRAGNNVKIHITTILAMSNIDEALDIARYIVAQEIDILQFVHIGTMEEANRESLIHAPERYDDVYDELNELSRSVKTFIALSERLGKEDGSESLDGRESAETGISVFHDKARGASAAYAKRKTSIQYALTEDGRYCLCPWYALFIDARGDVQPCSTKRDSKPMSNIINQNMEQVMNSIHMMELRKAVRDNRIEDECLICLKNNPFSMWGIEPLRYQPKISSLHDACSARDAEP